MPIDTTWNQPRGKKYILTEASDNLITEDGNQFINEEYIITSWSQPRNS